MRPSNKRSRSKQNRPRTLGNIINRVFDSSGPEGKVRGTPQQVIDKYQVLARDAQLSGDRVAAENFLQHSEHYQRMLNEAQAEMAREAEARREQQQQQGGQNRRNDERDGEGQQERAADRQNDGRQNDGRQSDARQNDGRQNDGRQGEGRMDWLGRRNRRGDGRNRNEVRSDAVFGDSDDGSMLVETPESRAGRETPAPDPAPVSAPEAGAPAKAPAAATDATAPAATEKPRAPRAPRNTRRASAGPSADAAESPADAQGGGGASASGDGAAEPAPRPKRAPRRRKADDGAAAPAATQSPDAAE